MKALIPLYQLTVGFTAMAVFIILNLSIVVDLTTRAPILLFSMNVASLITLSLVPSVMVRDGGIGWIDCSKLYLALAIGLVLGGFTVLGLGIAWHLILMASYTATLLATGSALTFMIGYSTLFWGLNRQIAEKQASGSVVSTFDATESRNFLKLLAVINVFVIFPLVALLLASDYLLAGGLAVYLVGFTLLGYRIHAWEVSKAGIG